MLVSIKMAFGAEAWRKAWRTPASGCPSSCAIRRIDGWKTLEKAPDPQPLDPPFDLAA